MKNTPSYALGAKHLGEFLQVFYFYKRDKIANFRKFG